jgi:hypothetical protein
MYKVYMIAWPNGERSIVIAKSREDAVFVLDEQGDAAEHQVVEAEIGAGFCFEVRWNEDNQPEVHPTESMLELLKALGDFPGGD